MIKIHNIEFEEYFPKYESDFIELEKKYWEKEAREQLMAFLINHHLKDSEHYVRLWSEYLNIVRQWKIDINDFENKIVRNIIPGDIRSWTLKFDTKELIVYEIC